MKSVPAKRNKPGQGRKPEGRVRGTLDMLPAAWTELDARRGTASRGKAVERLLKIKPAKSQKTKTP